MTIELLKKKSKALKKNIYLLYLIFRHPKTPKYVKVITLATIIYALSPIDLIPDFIPILGYIDDLIIVPAAILLSLRLTPKHIIEQCKVKEEKFNNIKKLGKYGSIIIMIFWLWVVYTLLKWINVI